MSDLIDRQAAIEALARMMPRSYTPDGSHPADEEIFRAQEVFADCIEALEILPSAQPATNCSEIPNGSDDTISRQAAIDALHTWFRDGFDEDKWWNSTHVLAAIEGLPSAQQGYKWGTCFECPLSHGCPKIKGCTNEQANEYARQIPNDCPLSTQPNHTADIGKKVSISCGRENDVISRKAAIANTVHMELFGRDYPVVPVEVLEQMPSAQPERNGKWIYNSPTTMKCDRCGFAIKDWDWHRFKYCPNCRADMRGEKDG